MACRTMGYVDDDREDFGISGPDGDRDGTGMFQCLPHSHGSTDDRMDIGPYFTALDKYLLDFDQGE